MNEIIKRNQLKFMQVIGKRNNKKALSIDKAFYQVPETGFEPAHPFGRYHLKVVRLPISPPGQVVSSLSKGLLRRGLMFDVKKTSNKVGIANVSGLLFQYNSEGGSFSGLRIFYKNFSFVVLLNDA